MAFLFSSVPGGQTQHLVHASDDILTLQEGCLSQVESGEWWAGRAILYFLTFHYVSCIVNITTSLLFCLPSTCRLVSFSQVGYFSSSFILGLLVYKGSNANDSKFPRERAMGLSISNCFSYSFSDFFHPSPVGLLWGLEIPLLFRPLIQPGYVQPSSYFCLYCGGK